MKATTCQDERSGSNNLLDTEPRNDDLKKFADQSWDETVTNMKEAGTVTSWQSQLPAEPRRKFSERIEVPKSDKTFKFLVMHVLLQQNKHIGQREVIEGRATPRVNVRVVNERIVHDRLSSVPPHI